MKADFYDSGATPVNKTSGLVISQGIHYTYHGKVNRNESSSPIPTRPLSDIHGDVRHAVGARFGRFTVVGLAVSRPRWVVRCACGRYALRTMRAMTNPKNTQDCCDVCRNLLELKRKEVRRRTGRDVRVEDLPGASPALMVVKPPKPKPPRQPVSPIQVSPQTRITRLLERFGAPHQKDPPQSERSRSSQNIETAQRSTAQRTPDSAKTYPSPRTSDPGHRTEQFRKRYGLPQRTSIPARHVPVVETKRSSASPGTPRSPSVASSSAPCQRSEWFRRRYGIAGAKA